MAIAPPSPSWATTSTSTSSPRRLIPISHLQGHFYIWSASDVLHLRSHHRIIGILTGSLPLLPQQNAYLGLPLELMPEEVGLLIQRRVAVLVEDDVAHGRPTKEQWQQWQTDKAEDITRQRQRAHDASIEQKKRFQGGLKSSGTGSGQGKREERQKQKLRLQSIQDKELQWDEDRAALKEARVDLLQEGISPSASTTPASSTFAQSADESSSVDLTSYNYTHTTYDSSSGLPWYTAPTSATSLSTSAQVSSSSSSSDPSPLLDLKSTKQCIFTHLNDARNFYLSCGLRFGGDFVAYPGDPFRYHSHYTLTVPKDDEEGFEVGRMIAQGRLGTAVKKVHLIATRRSEAEGGGPEQDERQERDNDNDKGRIAFYSLTWAGFGT